MLLPLSKWYAGSDRKTKVNGIQLIVSKGVFHPKLFFSTRFMFDWVRQNEMQQKQLLELGCGAGLLSIQAAKQGAIVTASDISETACLCCKQNAIMNSVSFKIYQSDLFTDIPLQQFDFILINPPYYPKNPTTESEYAWFCGLDFDYFQKLFFQMKRYLKADSKAIMVLSEDCNIEVIESLAVQNNFNWQMIVKKKMWIEENYLFQITVREQCCPKNSR